MCTWICIADGNDRLDRLSNRSYANLLMPLLNAFECNCRVITSGLHSSWCAVRKPAVASRIASILCWVRGKLADVREMQSHGKWYHGWNSWTIADAWTVPVQLRLPAFKLLTLCSRVLVWIPAYSSDDLPTVCICYGYFSIGV